MRRLVYRGKGVVLKNNNTTINKQIIERNWLNISGIIRKQLTLVTLGTSQCNHQSITNLSLKEFTELDYSEGRKWLLVKPTQLRVEVTRSSNFETGSKNMKDEHISKFQSVCTLYCLKSPERTRTRVGTCIHVGRSIGPYTVTKRSGDL